MAASEVSPYLTPPGQAFNCAELQQQFFGMSARDVYALLCKRSGCEPITAVSKLLPEKSAVWDTEELDLSRTYVGHRGVVPLTELCKLLHRLTTINLSNNYLTNKSVWHVCKMATFHPSLRTVDLSKNDVSWTAGMCVLELAVRNPAISTVNLDDTLIKPKVVDSITQQIRRNAFSGNKHHRRGPSATNHPTTVRMRALRRLFRDACQREGSKDGRLPRQCLVEGYLELLRLSGREHEKNQRSPAFFEAFAKRAKTDTVDWEQFMLLVMLEDATFEPSLVEQLRGVFNQYDPDGAGYVELCDLEGILQAVTGSTPTAAEVQSKLAFYAADATMTVTWEEFLLLMYDRGPVVGESASFASQTPMKRAKPTHH